MSLSEASNSFNVNLNAQDNKLYIQTYIHLKSLGLFFNPQTSYLKMVRLCPSLNSAQPIKPLRSDPKPERKRELIASNI